jgi:hypothetical protein
MALRNVKAARAALPALSTKPAAAARTSVTSPESTTNRRARQFIIVSSDQRRGRVRVKKN